MKKSVAKRIYIVGLALTAALVCSLVVRTYSADLKMGMTIEDVQKRIGSSHEINKALIDYENGPTEHEMGVDPVYMIKVRSRGLTLIFNHYRRLIEIKRFWGLSRERAVDKDESGI